jgi:hypothetical protein
MPIADAEGLFHPTQSPGKNTVRVLMSEIAHRVSDESEYHRLKDKFQGAR